MWKGHTYTIADPGLQAEETKLPGPGAGLCPGYTVSRAILADAIALTRGDRFYTHACKYCPLITPGPIWNHKYFSHSVQLYGMGLPRLPTRPNKSRIWKRDRTASPSGSTLSLS